MHKMMYTDYGHRHGNDFSVGEQKLNDFSVGEAKNGEKQSRQSNSKYNFTQCVFFRKRYTNVQWGLGQNPRSWGIFENFCVKSNLTVCNVAFNCKLQKNRGAGCASCSPNNFVGGATAPPVPLVPAPMCTIVFRGISVRRFYTETCAESLT